MNEKIVTSSLSKIAIPDQSASSFLLEKLLKSNESIILIDCDKNKKWTGKQIYDACLNISAALITEVGLRPDDVVLFAVPNSDVHALAILAVLSAGAVFCCVSSQLKFRELVDIVNITSPSLVVCCEENFQACQAVASEFLNIRLYLIEDVDSNSQLNGQIKTIESFINYNNNKSGLPIARSADDKAALMMSSGTTGKPKAMIRTNRNIIAIAISLNHDELAHYKPYDIVLSSCFCHMSGVRALGHVISCGATLVLMRSDVWEEEFLKNVEKFRITAAFLVPSQLYFLAKNFDTVVSRYDISSLQDVMYGGSALAESVYDNIKEKFKFKKFRQIYGMTEVGWATQVLVSQQEKNNKETVGQPTINTEIKVISSNFDDLSANQAGEICIRGPQVISGYLKNEEANKSSFLADGFLRTGDLGYYDECGQIYIVGRIKEVINVESEIVSPAEIEAVLMSHPAIRDAAVIGVEDESRGEIPKAFVVLREESVGQVNENDFVQFVSDRVHPAKQLRGGVCFMQHFPKTPLGKIRKSELKKMNEKLK